MVWKVDTAKPVKPPTPPLVNEEYREKLWIGSDGELRFKTNQGTYKLYDEGEMLCNKAGAELLFYWLAEHFDCDVVTRED